MKRTFLFFIGLILLLNSFGQNKRDEQIGISFPVLPNSTKIYNGYSGARATYISGSSVSYGVNVNYSRNFFKSIFLIGGVGYYAQNFGVSRPFDFDGDYTALLYYTNKYSYENINLLAGGGYKYSINKNYSVVGSAIFNYFHTFQQKYIPNRFSGEEFKRVQEEKRSYSFGQSINLHIGVYRQIIPKFSAGVDLVLPVYTRWRKDRIFKEDENEFYNSDFRLGANFSIKYNIHN